MSRSSASTLLRHLCTLVGASGATDHELLEDFAASRDETAFTTLLRRHGSLVWGVCRRLLPHEQDAEDAFQATFLVLARKAATLQKHDAVGNYLYGVAYRTALNVRKTAARRRERERLPTTATPEQPVQEAALRELQALLDSEVAKLPEKYRAPFVLCCLEGRSKTEAASELGWKHGTVSSRLAQARERLRQRLGRRGISLSAALTSLALGDEALATVPAALVASTQRVALAEAASVPVSAWAYGVFRILTVGWKAAALLFVAVSALATGALGDRPSASGDQPEPPAESLPLPVVNSQPMADQHGDPLPPGAICRLGTIRWRLDRSPAHCMTVSGDGKTLLVASPTTGISLMDLATGRIRGQLPDKAELRKAWLRYDTAVALSADGRTAALGVTDGTVHLLDTVTGQEGPVCRGHGGAVQEAALCAKGRTLVTRSSEGTLRVWDTASGKQLFQMPVPPKQWRQCHPVTLALSPDGRTMAWIGADKEGLIHVCDRATGKEQHVLGNHQGYDRQIVFAPDGQTLLAASDGGQAQPSFAQLWDHRTGKILHTWESKVRCTSLPTAAFTPDGKTLLLTVGGEALRRLDVATGQELWRVERRLASTNQDAFAFTRDGKTVVVAQLGGPVLYRYKLSTGKRLLDPEELDGAFHDLAFSPDERSIYSLNDNGVLRTWEAATGKEVHRLRLDDCWWGAFSPNGRFVLVGQGRTIRLHETVTGQELWQTAESWEGFSPDGRVVATSGKGKIVLREAASGKVLRSIPAPVADAFRLTFSPDGQEVMVHSGAHHGGSGVRFWNVATGRERCAWPMPLCEIFTLLLSPDGKTMVVGADYQRGPAGLILVEAATGEKRGEVRFDRVMSAYSLPPTVQFGPDGSRLLVADGAAGVAVLDPFTGQLLHTQQGHRAGVRPLVFSPSGRLLATGSSDTTALVWNTKDFLRPGLLPPLHLSEAELSALWQDLADRDAVKAAQAIPKLTRAAKQALPLLRQQLRPGPTLNPKDRKRLDQLLADLDSDHFEVRDRAKGQIAQLGEAALPQLEKVLADQPSVEVRRAVEQLAARLEPSQSPESRRSLRALEALEQLGTPEAREFLQKLADGAPQARLTREAKAALERHARKSPSP
jgi:RNA polymerase sigma factor (sigma-70 family)